MMSSSKILLNTAQRLGIKDSSAVKKAEEFLRVLITKPITKTLSDNVQTVLCLDLATTNLGIAFDKETALKLAGVRKSAYQNNLNNVEKILGLDRPVTISELCVQLSCTGIKEAAQNIWESYKNNDSKVKDITHPQYAAAAVYTACTLGKIKVNKAQLRSISRLKAAQWNELVNEFSKFASESGLVVTKQQKRSRKEINPNITEDPATTATPKRKEEECQIEEYEVWKERIIREATIEILNVEMNDE